MALASPGKQERIEEFLRKSLLGEELVNTQFHLFSARSAPSGRVVKPRVLCANNVLLAKSSKYFLDLLSSDINPSDPSLVDITDENDMPSNARVDEYGYASDSDLDDDDEETPSIPTADARPRKDRPARVSTSPPKISVTNQPKDDDELSEDGSESVSSDMFVMSPEHPTMDELSIMNLDGAISVASSEMAIQGVPENKTLENPSSTAKRLRSLGSRHILVKDTSFQTWYTLLNYLYTGKFSFLPLSSAPPGGLVHVSSTSSLDEPKCSAKSIYHLACKVGLDQLRDDALAHIRNNLSEHNILKELSCSLVSRHPELLEMELDVLYTHIASAPVVSGFRGLAQRIALRELPHGADVIVGIHERVLRARQSSLSLSPSAPRTPITLPCASPTRPIPGSAPVGPVELLLEGAVCAQPLPTICDLDVAVADSVFVSGQPSVSSGGIATSSLFGVSQGESPVMSFGKLSIVGFFGGSRPNGSLSAPSAEEPVSEVHAQPAPPPSDRMEKYDDEWGAPVKNGLGRSGVAGGKKKKGK